MTQNISEAENSGSNMPVHGSSRPFVHSVSNNYYSLYVLLGIGVLGALLTSVWVFGGFTPNRQTGLLTTPHGYSFRLFSTASLLFQGKMIALISMVFGAGMVLFMQKPNNDATRTRADIYIRRQFWLIVLGVLNAIIFLWTEDVLFHLGVMGILLFPFFRMSTRGLVIASVITILFFSAKLYWNYSDDKKAHNKYIAVLAVEKKIKQDSISKAALKDTSAKKVAGVNKADTLTKKQNEEKQNWEGIVKSKKYDPKKDEGTLKAMHKHEFGEIYDHLLPAVQSREAQWTYRLGIWDLSGMMFLGMALVTLGFFSGRLTSLQYFLLAIAGITAGLLLGWYRFYFHIEAIRDYEKYIVDHSIPYNLFFPFEQALMALGYAGAIMGFIRAGILRRIFRAVSSVGRLAITNYMIQSIICTLFFTGFGMGYFGQLRLHELYFFVAEIWLVQIVFSVLWLRQYDEGPVEWLWRCLTYKKLLPMKRAGGSITPLAPAVVS